MTLNTVGAQLPAHLQGRAKTDKLHGVQSLRTAEESRIAEENMAAVRSALADMLSHGGSFAGESQRYF